MDNTETNYVLVLREGCYYVAKQTGERTYEEVLDVKYNGFNNQFDAECFLYYYKENKERYTFIKAG